MDAALQVHVSVLALQCVLGGRVSAASGLKNQLTNGFAWILSTFHRKIESSPLRGHIYFFTILPF